MTSLRATTVPIQPVLDGTLAQGSDLRSALKWRQRWVLRCRRKSRKQVLNFSAWAARKPGRLGISWLVACRAALAFCAFRPGGGITSGGRDGGREKSSAKSEHSGDYSGFRGPLAIAGDEYL